MHDPYEGEPREVRVVEVFVQLGSDLFGAPAPDVRLDLRDRSDRPRDLVTALLPVVLRAGGRLEVGDAGAGLEGTDLHLGLIAAQRRHLADLAEPRVADPAPHLDRRRRRWTRRRRRPASDDLALGGLHLVHEGLERLAAGRAALDAAGEVAHPLAQLGE